jgi:hypothetical protein
MSDTPAPPVAPSEVKPSAQDELVALLKGAVEKKPTSVVDALKILHDLDIKIGVWLVSELSASQQKEVLAAKWAVNEVQEIATSWCFPKKN